MHQLQLPVNPVPCSRPRFSRQSGAVYHAKPYMDYRKTLEAQLRERWEEDPILVPVVVTIVCWVKAPLKSKLPHPKPDVDNYAKGVLDAMNGIVLQDDWLVQRVECEKHWAPPGDPGRIHIFIEQT